MKKLREFPDWPLEQVEEVARMLYALRPFKTELWHDEWRWRSLAREAFDFLDNLHRASNQIRNQRRKQGETYARRNARVAAAEKLPQIVPFNKAMAHITGQTRTRRARSNFEKCLHYNARREPTPIMRTASNMEAIVSPKLSAKKKRLLEAQIKTWRANGIPRAQVIELQSLFESEWPLVIAEQNRAKRKRRGARSDKRHGAKLPELKTVLMSN